MWWNSFRHLTPTCVQLLVYCSVDSTWLWFEFSVKELSGEEKQHEVTFGSAARLHHRSSTNWQNESDLGSVVCQWLSFSLTFFLYIVPLLHQQTETEVKEFQTSSVRPKKIKLCPEVKLWIKSTVVKHWEGFICWTLNSDLWTPQKCFQLSEDQHISTKEQHGSQTLFCSSIACSRWAAG